MFICAGYVLMKSTHNQDLRGLNPLSNNLIIDIRLLISILNLNGVAYLRGFYSKDAILDFDSRLINGMMVVIFSLSLLLTTFYSFRLLSLLNLFQGSVYYLKIKKVSLVPLGLTWISLVFGWIVVKMFFRIGYARGRFKGMIFFILMIGIFRFMYIRVNRHNTFLRQIGGLKFFKADFFLSGLTRVGVGIFTVVDSGFISLPLKWFDGRVRSIVVAQHTVFIFGIILRVVLISFLAFIF